MGAVASAFSATLCCLPALLFLLFGTSFGLLSWADALAEYRWILSGAAIAFFALSGYYLFRRPQGACSLAARKKRWAFIYVMVGVILLILLAYPEILGKIYGIDE